jgi:hypothetical protein
MYKLLFETEAEKTVESVNAAFLKETGESDWGYETIEDIEKAEKAGFLEFAGGTMKVFVEEN